MMKQKIADGLWLEVRDRDIIEAGKIVKGVEKAMTAQIKGPGGSKPKDKSLCDRFEVDCNGKKYYFYLGD